MTRPDDLIEDRSQFCATGRVDRFDKTHPPVEMRPEVGMSIPILAGPAMADAVRKDGFQFIEIGPSDVQMFVGHQSGELLPYTLAHNPCLAVVYLKALFKKYGGRMDAKPFNAPLEILGA
jgi:AMMECR1 domain-containing protein